MRRFFKNEKIEIAEVADEVRTRRCTIAVLGRVFEMDRKSSMLLKSRTLIRAQREKLLVDA